jgi:hypothetical protein
MGNNYLNSGESIILTTHSISVDEGLYDVLLTNERIVLVDNRYTRFEPRSIPFTQMISVKGGRIPSGEPVITLVLTETGSLADSRDRHLIFTQRPGEDRRHERDLWVKKLIELVVSARQHDIRQDTVSHEHEPGVKPSVRRWVAPDHLLPRTSPEKRPAPAMVVVEPDETKLPEFLFEESISSGELPDEEPGNVQSQGIREAQAPHEPEGSRHGEPAQPAPVPFPVLTRSHFTEDARPQGSPEAATPDIPAGGQSPYTGEADYADDLLAAEENYREAHAEPFSSTVLAAISALTSAREQPEPAGEPGHPGPEDRPKVPVPAGREVLPEPHSVLPVAGLPGIEHTRVPETPDRETAGVEIAGEAEYTGNRIPGPATFPVEPPYAESLPAPHLTVITEVATSRGKTPVQIAPSAGQEPAHLPQEPPAAKETLPTAALAVLAILLLVVGVILIALFLPPTHGSGVAPVTPVITIPPTVIPAETKIATGSGVRVRVISPGPYVGTIGNPGYLHQVSGSGDMSYTVLKNDDLISATVRKQDNSGSPLTVEIYNNGTLLTIRTVTAPMGEIQLLIDPKTGNPPGIASDNTRAANVTGAATLSYY